jgi:hypothetical protein
VHGSNASRGLNGPAKTVSAINAVASGRALIAVLLTKKYDDWARGLTVRLMNSLRDEVSLKSSNVYNAHNQELKAEMKRVACVVLGIFAMVGFGFAQDAVDPDANGVVAGSPSQSAATGPLPEGNGDTFIAVGWDFDFCPVGTIDSTTGAWTSLGTIGALGRCNSMARNLAGAFYTVTADGSGGDGATLTSIDPVTGAGTEVVLLTTGLDVRAMAFSPSDVLYAVNNGPGFEDPDELWTIDVATGTTTLVGSIGSPFDAVQGMAFDFGTGVLYATDNTEGLLTIDPSTGVGTDVSGEGGDSGVQTITVTADGTLWGAGANLFTIDKVTGVYTQVAMGDYPDLRGMEPIGPIPVELMSISVE